MKTPHTLLLTGLMISQLMFAQTNVTIQVDAGKGKKAISPYIYGKNNNVSDNAGSPNTSAEWKLMREAGLRFTRENGGNNASKYNWRRKLSSHPDWYNNIYAHNWDFAAKSLGDSMPSVQGMWAFQLSGKAAKTTTQNFNDWAYNQSQSWSGVSQNLAGGGVPNTAGGSAAQTEGNPALYLEDWNADSTAGILDHWFGPNGIGLDKNKILYWNMDNEVDIWSGTHDDIFKTQPAAETFMQTYFSVAKKARAKYPAIKLVGPVTANEWQWYSWNNSKISVSGQSYVWLEFFIKRIAEEQTTSGIRLLDVLDIHFYPNEGNDSDIVQLHRVFYDSTYSYPGANGVKTTSPSGWDNSITKEYIFERCNQWLKKYIGPNHGVTFSVTEIGVNGNNANVSAVWYASTLGVFADNGTELFSPWFWKTGMWETLHLFSRYGKSIRVQSVSNQERYVSGYSSLNNAGDSMTVILVNRSQMATKNTTVNLAGFTTTNGNYNTLRINQLPGTETFVSHTSNALKTGTAAVSGNSFTLSLPPLSITAVLLKGNALTGVNEHQQAAAVVRVYPNPVSGKEFTIDLQGFGKEERVGVAVYDIQGRELYKKEMKAGLGMEITIEKGLQSGLYFLQVEGYNTTVAEKVIVK